MLFYAKWVSLQLSCSSTAQKLVARRLYILAGGEAVAGPVPDHVFVRELVLELDDTIAAPVNLLVFVRLCGCVGVCVRVCACASVNARQQHAPKQEMLDCHVDDVSTALYHTSGTAAASTHLACRR